MFEKIKNDPNSKDGFWVYHGLNHFNNVIKQEKIIK